MVCCKQQCGTDCKRAHGCCVKDLDGHCCATVCCFVQCDIGTCTAFLAACATGVLCCAGKLMMKTGVQAGGAVAGATAAAGSAAAATAFLPLCGICCADTCICLKLSALPCWLPFQFADNAQRIEGSTLPYCVDCTAYALLMPCNMCCLVAGPKRTVLRTALNMEGSECKDRIWHCFCPCAALVQEKELLDKDHFTRNRSVSREASQLEPPSSETIERSAV